MKARIENIGSTGNISADLIIGAIRHYQGFNRTIKIASLSGSYWRIFKKWMEIQAPELTIPPEGIQFNNILIRKGSLFQSGSIVCELNPIISSADSVKTESVKNRSAKVISIKN